MDKNIDMKNKNLRVLKQCSCDTKSLSLTTGNIASPLLNPCIVFIRHSLNEFICTGLTAGFYAILLRRIFITPSQIIKNSS